MNRAETVFLVGAGPGDPELLTLKASRLITSADAIVHDRLVSPEIIDLVPPGRILINVGKRPGAHPVPQVAINRILLRLARAGHQVVRLKGGDPMVFGRGGEEAKYLLDNGIKVETVPGITAAQGCAASLNLALTERGIADSVTYLAGHTFLNTVPDIDCKALIRENSTLVIYMGATNIPAIVEKLLDGSYPASTPVLAICNGTMPNQKHVETSLANHAIDLSHAGFDGPVLFIIGEAARLHYHQGIPACAEMLEMAIATGI